MKREIVSICVMAVLTVILLAACGGMPAVTPETKPPPVTPETKPPPVTAETTPPVAPETKPPVTLGTAPVTLGIEVKVEGGFYRLITADQLVSILRNKDFFMVCSTPGLALDIPNTDLTISYKEISRNLAKFPQNKASRIVVYDGGDETGHIATETLVKAGYTSVTLLDGGMNAWKNLLE